MVSKTELSRPEQAQQSHSKVPGGLDGSGGNFPWKFEPHFSKCARSESQLSLK
jgi:hypothetical protein